MRSDRLGCVAGSRRGWSALAVGVGLLALGGAPAAATADPPQPPPGCGVVIGTPAATTGSAQGQDNKLANFARLCT